ncbi:Hypothetical predicted protein [Marmota monax]|uniref:Uncharacterized protein n=1 Tax=Marmota monax TaxID=9995 RepID=A0A5E4BV63_MARMO|nr:Hypothetical predicted protein [Marmota monax]
MSSPFRLQCAVHRVARERLGLFKCDFYKWLYSFEQFPTLLRFEGWGNFYFLMQMTIDELLPEMAAPARLSDTRNPLGSQITFFVCLFVLIAVPWESSALGIMIIFSNDTSRLVHLPLKPQSPSPKRYTNHQTHSSTNKEVCLQ